LSKVIHPFSYIKQISSPVYCSDMTREEIIAGSTEESMRSLYYRKPRASIYHPATIGDVPQEVLRLTFMYLLPSPADLVAPSEACRAWRPVAQELMYYREDDIVTAMAMNYPSLASIYVRPSLIPLHQF
jgi:hypothetical protein